MAAIGKDIDKARHILIDGGIVGIPTETVYGLAANALNEEAVIKIFEAKARPHFDPLIIHIPSLAYIYTYVTRLPESAEKLAQAFWPGPLTLLLPKADCIPDLVTSGSDFVAVRVPNHPLTIELLKGLPFPLAAPSANPFGYISPTTAVHVNNQLGQKVDYILDGGPSRIGLESTIVGFNEDKPVIMRLGGLSIDEIEKVCGKAGLQLNNSSNPLAPGQLSSHYSPRKPLYTGKLKELLKEHQDKRIGLISYFKEFTAESIAQQWQLSLKQDINEAACNLFSILREADDADIDCILAEYVPETGLGAAINDRLQRASVK
jgi:L-threonylcarbamoyladenylate synthase